ncbi:MAG: hypothetical protein P1P87_13415 [Trueperaceae bacterium]|nr:hypothetical protein [Trueperaceae bacterium]
MNVGPYAPREPMPDVAPPRPERRSLPRGLGPGEVATEPRPRGATRAVPPDDPACDPRRPVRIGRGVTALLVVACTVGALQVAALTAVEVRRWWIADREVVRLEREVAALQADVDDLAAIAGRGDDARFREHLARRQGYVFPDEVRYVVVGPEPAPPTAPVVPPVPAAP